MVYVYDFFYYLAVPILCAIVFYYIWILKSIGVIIKWASLHNRPAITGTVTQADKGKKTVSYTIEYSDGNTNKSAAAKTKLKEDQTPYEAGQPVEIIVKNNGGIVLREEIAAISHSLGWRIAGMLPGIAYAVFMIIYI